MFILIQRLSWFCWLKIDDSLTNITDKCSEQIFCILWSLVELSSWWWMTKKFLCSSSFYIRYLHISNRLWIHIVFPELFGLQWDSTALAGPVLSTGHFWATAVSFFNLHFFFLKYAHNKLIFKLPCRPVWGIRKLKLSYQSNGPSRVFAGISSWLLKCPCRLFFFTSKLNCSSQSDLGK